MKTFRVRKVNLLMKRFYRAHFLGVELFISIILVTILTFITYKFIGFDDFQSTLNDVRDMLYGTLATLSGALLGFVITGLSVLLTTSTNKQIETLKRSKHYKTIFKIFFSTSKYLGVLLIFSLMGIVFDKDASPIIFITITTLWALIIVAFRLLRCVWVLERIVKLHILDK